MMWQMGFSGDSVIKNSACQCRRHKRSGFDPWVGKIPSTRKWQPTSVFLPGKFHGQRRLQFTWGCKESDTIEHAQMLWQIFTICVYIYLPVLMWKNFSRGICCWWFLFSTLPIAFQNGCIDFYSSCKKFLFSHIFLIFGIRLFQKHFYNLMGLWGCDLGKGSLGRVAGTEKTECLGWERVGDSEIRLVGVNYAFTSLSCRRNEEVL